VIAVFATFSAVAAWPMSPSTSDPGFGHAARGGNDVVAAIQKSLDDGRSDALRGTGYDYCLFASHLILSFLSQNSPWVI
jgi:hypothetical protein